jgi:hypothetical protein
MRKSLVILLLLTAFGLQAQGRFKEKKEQIKALKNVFISTELNLTPTEAEKFWPLYNAFENTKREIKHDKKQQLLEANDDNIDQLSAKDAMAFLAKSESIEDNLYQERKKFIQSLKEFLPAIKILKLKKAEESFNLKLLQQFRNKKNVN